MKTSAKLSSLAHETFLSIARDGHVNGVNYNNLVFSGKGVDDAFDPDVKISPILVAGYWPGGVDAEGHEYMMHGVNNYTESNINDDRIFMRELLRGAVLSPAAVERHRQRLSPEERRIERAGEVGSVAIKSTCAMRQIPYSYAMVSQVVASETIEPGKRLATLYYPMGLPPETALDALREEVGKVIVEEII
jgi:hypothetical protein